MKKTISIIATFMLVFAFAGVASAEIAICTPAGNIDRGCQEPDVDQAGTTCYEDAFDYDDFYGNYLDGDQQHCYNNDSYCDGPAKGEKHRALFKICDCITEGIFESVDTDDTIDIGMEILVDKHDGNGLVVGNNGVYWAQDVNSTGIGVEPFASEGAACDEDDCYPDYDFDGDFDYFLADGTMTDDSPVEGRDDCNVPEDQEIVKFIADPTQTGNHGYVVKEEDATDNQSVWWIDIPELRTDSNITNGTGWDVWVRICLYTSLDTGGVCGECEGCCYDLLIGTLCCETSDPIPETCHDTLTFPYIPNPAGSYWFGMAVTNLSSEAGTATVTLYEEDGDMATGTVTVNANTPGIIDLSTLTPSGGATIGDAKGYAVVVTDFDAMGFGFMSGSEGSSMGYLAEKCGDCSTCYYK